MAEILKTLNGARKSIRVSMFVFTLDMLADFLIFLKSKRSIFVEILTDRCKRGDSQIAKLMKAGIEVRWNTKALMHDKYCIVDQRILISGSANWSHPAFNSNDETLIWSEIPAMIGPFLLKFKDCFNSASPSLVIF